MEQDNTRDVRVKRFLDIFPGFRQAPGDLTEKLVVSSRLQSFPAGQTLYLEGDRCSHIAFVLSGEIRVFKPGETGREITLYFIEPGETCILNASCIMGDMPYPANAVSNSAGEMLLLPGAAFRELIDAYDLMRTFVFSILSRRLATVMALIEEVAFGKMDQRLLDYLTKNARNGMLKITHQGIANDLGTSREVVSRILKDFERQNILELSRNLIRIR